MHLKVPQEVANMAVKLLSVIFETTWWLGDIQTRHQDWQEEDL